MVWKCSGLSRHVGTYLGRLVVWPACWAVIVAPSLAHVWVIVGGPFDYGLACHVILEYVWFVVTGPSCWAACWVDCGVLHLGHY